MASLSKPCTTMAILLASSTIAHLITRSCGLFLDSASSGSASSKDKRTSVLIDYRWETVPSEQANFSIVHQKKWAQTNHICPAWQTALISRVRLTVDDALTCNCHPDPSTAACESLHHIQVRSGWDGVAGTTRLFVGDSRMSGDARLSAHTVHERCKTTGGAFRRSAHYGDPQVDPERKRDFAIWCESINAWVLYVRCLGSNRLIDGWLTVRKAINAMLVNDTQFAGTSVPSESDASNTSTLPVPLGASSKHVEVIFGSYVWDVIERGGSNVSDFLHRHIEESILARFYAELRAAMPHASFVLRAAPPANPTMTSSGPSIEGPLSGNLALIRNAHDSWVAQEQAFAARRGIDFLNAFQVITAEGSFPVATALCTQPHTHSSIS